MTTFPQNARNTLTDWYDEAAAAIRRAWATYRDEWRAPRSVWSPEWQTVYVVDSPHTWIARVPLPQLRQAFGTFGYYQPLRNPLALWGALGGGVIGMAAALGVLVWLLGFFHYVLIIFAGVFGTPVGVGVGWWLADRFFRPKPAWYLRRVRTEVDGGVVERIEPFVAATADDDYRVGEGHAAYTAETLYIHLKQLDVRAVHRQPRPTNPLVDLGLPITAIVISSILAFIMTSALQG